MVEKVTEDTAGGYPVEHPASLLPQPVVGAGTLALALLALVATWQHSLPAGFGVLSTSLAFAAPLGAALVLAYRYPIQVGHQTKVALVTVVHYLLAILVVPPLAATMAGLGALAGELSQQDARRHAPVPGKPCRRD